MAGGQKRWRKRSLEGAATFEGTELAWRLESEPSWSNSGDGYKGLCISVRVVDGSRRELIIEYPFPTDKAGRKLPIPQRPPVSQAMIERSIAEAANAGWDPTSRGKTFVFHAD